MKRNLAILCVLFMLAAVPATPFWGAFFAGIGKAVGKAFGIGGGKLNAAGLMPVTIRSAKPVIDAAQQRLAELQRIQSMASSTLDHYAGVAGTLRELGSLDRFRAPAAAWLRSATANAHGTSRAWARALNGETAPGAEVAAYGAATAPVPDWTAALPTLPGPWRATVEREHATLELADAASVRSLAVLGALRRTAPRRDRAHDALENDALNPARDAQAVPALLGKVAVGQVRQIRGSEQTNLLLDALLEAEVAGLKRERDRLAHSMQAAAEYRALAAAQPPPNWRMP